MIGVLLTLWRHHSNRLNHVALGVVLCIFAALMACAKMVVAKYVNEDM